MGSVIEGGTSAAVNMRDPNGASIVFISPPKNRHAANPFRHQVAPAIDPENYKPPTVGDVMSARNASAAEQ
jgi:hypothetical protein